MGKLKKVLYTVVQHSGVQTGHSEFKYGLEEARVETEAQRALVEKAGGVLFTSYSEAADYAMTEQYQEDNRGLIPHAPGTFSSRRLHGRKVYRPVDSKPAREAVPA